MRAWLPILAAVVALLTGSGATVQLAQYLDADQSDRQDLAELRHLRFGLLDAGAWAERIGPMLAKELDAFLSPESQGDFLREKIESWLYSLTDRQLEELDTGNYGLIEGIGISMCMGQIRKQIPQLSADIVEWLQTDKSQDGMSTQLQKMLRTAVEGTDSLIDRGSLEAILDERGCENQTACAVQITEAIEARKSAILQLLLAIVCSFVILLLICHYAAMPPVAALTLPGLASLALLVGGISVPMMDVEAVIDELAFQLAGNPLSFKDQVLYFQSKSILDVVWELLSNQRPDVMVVGVLVGTFSIIFPLSKLIASFLWYRDLAGARNNRVLEFFALYSGKWSMADVFVVATVMAYVGFQGIISSELSSITGEPGSLQMLATNGTALRPGFYLFLGFCLLNLYLSGRMKRLAAPKDSS